MLICDRYFYDDIVQMLYLGISSKAFIGFYKSLMIKPDLIFFIRLDAEAARSRKNEYDKDYFEQKCSLYGRILKNERAIELSGRAKQEENQHFILEQVSQVIRQR